MSKQSLLLVDGDTRSLRVLEVSLRKAGFSVTPAVSVGDALDKLQVNAPDLIISETKFTTDLDGFELRRRLRGTPDWADIPFIFLTAETAIENKIKGLELGVDDYLTKPIYIKEIVTRINILLQKRQRQFLDLKKDGTRFAGRVADMPVVDVIQTIEVSRKSGVIQFSGGPNRQAAIYFRDGKVIDAEAGTLQGEDAVYRLLTWNDGEFEVEFRTVRRREAISTSSQGLLMEGMRRLDEWSRLLEQLPPLTHRFEIDAAELSTRLGEVPDDNNRILRLFDGKRTLLEVIDASDFGDLECLQAISRLYFEGLLLDLDPDVKGARRDTGKSMALTVVDETPTPIEEVASGPLAALDNASVAATVEPQAPARPSTESISDQQVISEEEAPLDIPLGPLTGGYRPSSLRLIDEAVAAAQAIEPSLFEPEELIAAGITPRPPEAPTALARVTLAARTSDPRIENARDLVERTPALEKPPLPTNGRRAKTKSQPPPIPTRSQRQLDDIPLLEAEPYTSGEIKIPSEQDIADLPLLEAEPYTSGEMNVPSDAELAAAAALHDQQQAAAAAVTTTTDEDYSGVPNVIEATEDQIEDDGGVGGDTVRLGGGRIQVVRRQDSQSFRMIGSHGRDRAEASGELRPPPLTPAAAEPTEPQRELVTIMPRRITREHPVQESQGAEAANEVAPETTVETKSKPAVEPPAHPARRVSVAGGVVRAPSGPGRGSMILLSLAAILVGATLVSYCRKATPPQHAVVTTPDATVPVVVAPTPDAPELTGGGEDAGPTILVVTMIDAGVPRRPDAAAVVITPKDAGTVAVAPTADAGVDKGKEARVLYDKAHTALEEGDPDAALALLDQSLKLRKTARTLLERARALQRLNRIDDAIAAVDDAIALNTSYAPAYEQKGMILWSAQRYSDARPALEKYLELDPNGRKAETIRGMLNEQK